MGLFDKFKELSNKVLEVENNIYNEKRDYLEIYERNQELEKEIAERTAELHDANRRMLTLQHIWDMMNSSTPLENVLDAIVNSTQGELGYMHCVIIRKYTDEEGDYCRIIAQSKDNIIERLNFEYKGVYDPILKTGFVLITKEEIAKKDIKIIDGPSVILKISKNMNYPKMKETSFTRVTIETSII